MEHEDGEEARLSVCVARARVSACVRARKDDDDEDDDDEGARYRLLVKPPTLMEHLVATSCGNILWQHLHGIYRMSGLFIGTGCSSVQRSVGTKARRIRSRSLGA